MKIKVQYTTMIVKDLDESVRFYRDVLGFTEGYHVGLYSVGTDVDDLDEALQILSGVGYQTTGPVIPTTVGKMTFVLDPNGVRICLIEHDEEYKRKYME